MFNPLPLHEACVGSMLGTAVGDSMGLPFERLGPERIARRKPVSGQSLVLGRGMVSDDTEHTCAVAQALIEAGGDAAAFEQAFARRLKVWLLGAPGGIGLATLRACMRLAAGIPPEKSGVFSAGNGPAMRSAILGVAYGDDLPRLRALVRCSTRITHTDPKAEYGALAVALAAHWSRATGCAEGYVEMLVAELGGDGAELTDLVQQAAASAARGETTDDFVRGMGWTRGISGYTYRTVPGALHAWMRHPADYSAAVLGVIYCGGDTDSTAAIAGGIVGAGVGRSGIPAAWLNRICEWPRSVAWMERLAEELARTVEEGTCGRPPELFFPAVLGRNMAFAGVVVAHVVARKLGR